jgi:hypothetical protein
MRPLYLRHQIDDNLVPLSSFRSDSTRRDTGACLASAQSVVRRVLRYDTPTQVAVNVTDRQIERRASNWQHLATGPDTVSRDTPFEFLSTGPVCPLGPTL